MLTPTFDEMRSEAAGDYEEAERFGDGGYAVSVFLSGWDAEQTACESGVITKTGEARRNAADVFAASKDWSHPGTAVAIFLDGWNAALKARALHRRARALAAVARVTPAPIRTAKNDTYQIIHVGDKVGRIDNYKKDGKVMAINHDRGYAHVLVRWPGLVDEWMHPGILTLPELDAAEAAAWEASDAASRQAAS